MGVRRVSLAEGQWSRERGAGTWSHRPGARILNDGDDDVGDTRGLPMPGAGLDFDGVYGSGLPSDG